MDGGVDQGAGLVDGGVDQGPWLQERVGGGVGAMAVPKRGLGLGWLLQRGASQWWRGCKGFGSGRALGTEQIQRSSGKSREVVREGLAWRWGGGARASVPGG